MTASDKNRRLGRGLSALLGEPDIESRGSDTTNPAQATPQSGVQSLPIELIRPNPDQPRRNITTEELKTLSDSIAEKGIVQPILVRPIDEAGANWEIVAGERRWRAAQIAQLHEIPALIRELTDRETLEIAIVENVQRADLNPVEEARGYKQLIDHRQYCWRFDQFEQKNQIPSPILYPTHPLLNQKDTEPMMGQSNIRDTTPKNQRRMYLVKTKEHTTA